MTVNRRNTRQCLRMLVLIVSYPVVGVLYVVLLAVGAIASMVSAVLNATSEDEQRTGAGSPESAEG